MHLPRGVSEVTFFNLIAHTLLSKLWTGVRHSRSFLEIATAYIYIHMSIYVLYIYIFLYMLYISQVTGQVVWQVEPLHIYIYMSIYVLYIFIYCICCIFPRWRVRSSGRWSHCIYINMSQVLLYGNYDMSQNNATSKTKVKAMKQSNIPLVTRRHEHKQQRRIEHVWTKRKTWDHFIFKTILTTHKQMNRVSRTHMQER